MRRSLLLLSLAAVLASSSALAANDGKNRLVMINNQSNYVVNEIYASNTSASDWQEDILGEDVLAPGQSLRANIDDGTAHCVYDFRVVFEDGTEAEKFGFDVCAQEALNITSK